MVRRGPPWVGRKTYAGAWLATQRRMDSPCGAIRRAILAAIHGSREGGITGLAPSKTLAYPEYKNDGLTRG
ncbi:protein of unknown function [Pseudomonas marincola]|uniref:Uncharacterized protein n=1 Tax=Pseudomonas marincola TaxID=437900 RepID=A0A8S2BJV0_9PSED|nr:protein of unknown function [Pseudomonas marincola]